MRTLFEAVCGHARNAPDRIAFTDAAGTLTRGALVADAARLAAALPSDARTVGLLMPNCREWAVAQLALVAAGRICVPIPSFFSDQQIAHLVQDAGIDLILTTQDGAPAAPGLPTLPVRLTGMDGPAPTFRPGYGTLIYTSGSTGRPKGVRHESGQVSWSATALAKAIGASAEDAYLSVLPLSLLLEGICAVFIPLLVGGRVHFSTSLSEAVGRGAPSGIADAFDRHRPTVAVLVPELLRLWVGELMAAGRRAPETLRFVAVGGAAVPGPVAAAAWGLGIPVHEGYGLSECCSVVTLNRPGARVAGTVGTPLEGLAVSVRGGEIHVDGPCVTDGYLGGPAARRPWATGDLGALDGEGRLTVFGRKDALIVTPFGRNISPEWVEATLQSDPHIAFCAVGAGAAGLSALVVPAPAASAWFEAAGPAGVAARIEAICAALPAYARPVSTRVVPLPEAKALGLLTQNGRIRRSVARDVLAAAS